MKFARCCWMALLLVGGCDDDGGTVTPSSNPPPPPPSSAGSVTVMVGPNGQNSFDPQTVTISRGATVTWQWMSGLHTVTSGAGDVADGKFCSLASGTPSPDSCESTSYAQMGGSYSHTFDTEGTYPYFCEVHGATMSGTVVVTANGSGGGGGGGGGGGY
jgi:plastocyanin